jgi:hypothetical protein
VQRLGPLPADEVERIGRVLIQALAVAHRHGVVHRDVKPANVLFDGFGRPALADFGVAVTRELPAGLTEAGSVVGTPMWMAPEQARGEAAAPAGDVFSLAATLGFAATGAGPYAPGPAAVVMARAARNEILPLGSAVPDELGAPLARMLDPRPERRPSAAAIVGGLDGTAVSPVPAPGRAAPAAVVRRFLTSGLVRLLGDPRARPVERSPHRRLVRLAGAASAVLVVGPVVAVALAGPRSGSVSAAAKAPDAVCTPLPYFACGASVPAAHTDGTTCDPGWYDMDGLASDGCEARSDFSTGTTLTSTTVRQANLVPASARDSFALHVSGSALRLCWGSLHVTLTAPDRTAEQLTLWKGSAQVATAVSVSGKPATATVSKPSCFGADSEDLRATVSVVAATPGASASNFTLTRDAGWS